MANKLYMLTKAAAEHIRRVVMPSCPSYISAIIPLPHPKETGVYKVMRRATCRCCGNPINKGEHAIHARWSVRYHQLWGRCEDQAEAINVQAIPIWLHKKCEPPLHINDLKYEYKRRIA